MSLPLDDTVWITLMHELKSFVRYQLEKPETMAEVRQLMAPPETGRYGMSSRIRAAEVVRAFELLAPALMVDFLADNPEILNPRSLCKWADEREGLHVQEPSAESTALSVSPSM
jgi:hypothetical protein